MIDLYSWATPNGQKVAIMLEETGLEYTVHPVHLGKGEQKTPEFLARNPNGKIPVIVDRDGPGGKPLTLFESGAILLYLAEKSGKLLGATPADKWTALQWVMFQMSAVGPIFGQLGYFAGLPEKNAAAIERFYKETVRIHEVLEHRLAHAPYLAGDDYTIADVCTWPWVAGTGAYLAKAGLTLPPAPHLEAWIAKIAARPAVQKGKNIPPRA